MSRCIIVSSGHISNYSFYISQLKDDDYIICADGGIRHILSMDITPNLWIGDFDSCNFSDILNDCKHLRTIETITLNTDKDVTDTHFACTQALNRGFSDIVLWGACGGRIDHMLSNIQLLEYFDKLGVNIIIQDEQNTIRICSNSVSISKKRKYVSLLPVDNTVVGVNTQGLKYSLHDYTMLRGVSLGVSNEIIEECASISVKSGRILVVESDDA